MLKKFKINNNLNYLYYPTKKYKSFMIKIYFFLPFNKKKITIRNLLKDLLNYNSKNYSYFDLLAKRKSLYNLSWKISNLCSSNLHRYVLTISGTNPKYFNDEEYTFDKIFELINEVLFNPNIEDNLFDEETFNYCSSRYKNSLIKTMENKDYIVVYESTKLLPKNDVNNYFNLGYLEDFEKITNEALYKEYQDFLKSKILISVAGDIDNKELKYNFRKYFNNFSEFKNKLISTPTKYQKEKIKIIKYKTEQSILMMTFASEISQFSEKYFDLLMLNVLYGEDVSSKLFQVIREKYGYCYDIYSMLDATSGTIIVYMGIDYKNIKKAKVLVLDLLNEIKEGKFSKTLLSINKKNNYSEVQKIYDNLDTTLTREVNLYLFNRDSSLKTLKESLNGVTKEEIMNCANNIKLISTVIMKPKRGE